MNNKNIFVTEQEKPQYVPEITSNITSGQDLKATIMATLDTIADTIGCTLGPFGLTSIIQDRELDHTISKDGYSVLKQIMFKEDIPRTVLDLVRKINQAQVRSVGDGSSSSTIVARNIYRDLFFDYDRKFQHVSQTEMIAIVNYIRDIIEETLKKTANPITDENKLDVLTKIAAISTNNDKTIGKFIAEVMSRLGKYSFVDLQLGKKQEHEVEYTKGFSVHRGVIDTVYVNQEDRKTTKLEDVYTLHISTKINKNILMQYVYPAIEYIQTNKPNATMVIIGNGYDNVAKDFLRSTYLNVQENKLASDKFEFVCIDMALVNPDHEDLFEDLEYYLNAQVIVPVDKNQKEFDPSMLGHCKEFTSAEGTSKFIEVIDQDTKRLQTRLDYIDEKIQELDNFKQGIYDTDDVRLKLIRRHYALTQDVAVIYVGGATPTERETTQYLIEDAVYACKSALENGFIIGGNLSIPSLIHHQGLEMAEIVYSKLINNYGESSVSLDDVKNIVQSVGEAFKGSFKEVLSKLYSPKEADAISNECIEDLKIFNLKSMKYESVEETSVINSAMTDIQIMYSCFSLIGLLGTSNQFLSTTLNK